MKGVLTLKSLYPQSPFGLFWIQIQLFYYKTIWLFWICNLASIAAYIRGRTLPFPSSQLILISVHRNRELKQLNQIQTGNIWIDPKSEVQKRLVKDNIVRSLLISPNHPPPPVVCNSVMIAVQGHWLQANYFSRNTASIRFEFQTSTTQLFC